MPTAGSYLTESMLTKREARASPISKRTPWDVRSRSRPEVRITPVDSQLDMQI